MLATRASKVVGSNPAAARNIFWDYFFKMKHSGLGLDTYLGILNAHFAKRHHISCLVRTIRRVTHTFYYYFKRLFASSLTKWGQATTRKSTLYILFTLPEVTLRHVSPFLIFKDKWCYKKSPVEKKWEVFAKARFFFVQLRKTDGPLSICGQT